LARIAGVDLPKKKHIDVALSFKKARLLPYIKGSFISLGGDDPATTDVEAYDPLFFGWVDWSKWWIGSITSWELVTTNEKVWMLEAGITPTQATQFRIQFLDFNLNKEMSPGSGRQWSQEINTIFDWYPAENSFYGIALNYAHPRGAAVAFNGDNENVTELVVWGGVSF